MSEKIILLLLAAAVGLSSFIPSPSEMRTYFEKGQKLFVIEDYPNAIEKFEKVRSIKSPFLNEAQVMITLGDEFVLPVQIAATYQSGNSYKNLKQYDQAVICFKEVEEQAPIERLRILAQYQIVLSRYNQENYAETIAESKILLEKYSQSKYVERGYYNIGWASYQLKKYDQAIDYFTQQLERFPEGEYAPRTQYQIGECHTENRAYQQAIEAYRKLIKNYIPEGFSQRQWSDLELDRLKKRTQIEQGVGKGRKEEHVIELSAKAFIKIGDAFLELNQPDSAIAAFRRVTEDYKPLADLVETAFIKIGELEFKQNGLDASLAVYRQAIDDSEDRMFQGKMQYQIAKVSLDNKAYQQAIAEFELYVEGYEEVAEEIDFTLDEARYQIAAAHYEALDFDNAITNYQVVIDSFHTSYLVPASHYGIGLSQQRKGEFEKAIETFHQFIDTYPKNEQVPNARLQIARIQYDKKDYTKSITSYQQLLNEYSDSTQIDLNTIYFEMGICYRDAGNGEQAIQIFKKISKDSPMLPGAYSEISEIYLKQNNFSQAEETLLTILDVLSETEAKAQIHYYLGRVYVTSEEYDKALEHFNVALAALTNPQLRASTLFGRGAIYFEENEFEKAAADFEALFKEDADRNTRNKARRRLVTCYLKMKQPDKALNIAESFVADAKTDVDKGDALLTLAQMQYELAQYAQGINTTNEIVRLDVEDEVKVQAYFFMGNCCLGQADYPQAISIYDNTLGKYPNTKFASDLLFQLGIAHYNSGDFESASNGFKRLVSSYPRSENALFARYYLGYSFYKLGDWGAATEAFGSIANRYPDRAIAAECRFQEAECLFNNRNFEMAFQAYQRVHNDYPGSEYAALSLYNSAWSLVNQNKTDEAMNIFQKIVEIYPDSVYAVDALFTLGDYHYNNRSYIEATRAYQKVVSSYPEHELAEKAKAHIHELAQITSYLEYEKASELFDQKKYKEAIEAFKTITEKYPDADVVIGSRCNIAAAYEQLGRMQTALKLYEEIIELYEDSSKYADAYAFAKEHRDWIKENY